MENRLYALNEKKSNIEIEGLALNNADSLCINNIIYSLQSEYRLEMFHQKIAEYKVIEVLDQPNKIEVISNKMIPKINCSIKKIPKYKKIGK